MTISAPPQALVLVGQPSIHEFVRFVRSRAVDGHSIDETALTREWRNANGYVRELESIERDVADSPALSPLPDSLAACAKNALVDPVTQRCLGFLPHSWAMVELDRLLVWQKYVDPSVTARLGAALPRDPTPEQLFDVATGKTLSAAPLHITAPNANSFLFSAESSDLRVLGTAPLDAAQVTGFQPFGNAVAVVAVFVGYSVNFVWAVQFGKRLALINGTHRAYALRALGITHVPCLVSHATHREDLELMGAHSEREALASQFTRPRPAMLKDFFNERLCKQVPLQRSLQALRIEVKAERLRHPIP